MAGVTSSYPSALDSESNLTPPNNGDTLSVADHWLAGNAGPIVAIETELGTDPAGSFTDVKSRLNDTDGKVITEIDQFELDSSFNITTTSATIDITTNLSRNAVGGFSQKGTGMTVSSGEFTFPSTGYYQILWTGGFVSPAAASQYTGIGIALTQDDFSTQQQVFLFGSMYTTSTYLAVSSHVNFKVDDTTTHKCKFNVHTQQTVTLEADRTTFTFIRLGDI